MNPLVPLLCLYLLALACITALGVARVRSAADFWIAGGGVSALSTGGSLVATIVGGSSTLGMAGLAFRRGLTGGWWLLAGAVGLTALVFLVKGLKTGSYYTLPELISRWYGPIMGKISGMFIMIAWLGIVGAQAAAAGTILATFLGGQSRSWMLAAGAVFVAYTLCGGQISVIRTDLLQAAIIAGGIALCTGFALQQSGGFRALRAVLPPAYFSFPVSELFPTGQLLLMLLVVASTYLIGPDMLSRVFSARNARSARRAIIITISAIIPLALLVTTAGMTARVLFPHAPPETALPILARSALPPWAGALVMLALLSAFLSSADTTLLTMSAILTVNILGRKDPARLIVPRLSVLGCGAAGVAVGVFSGGIIPSLLLGYSVFAGALFVPILAGALGRAMGKTSAIAAAVLGGACALAGKLLNNDPLVAASFAVGITAAVLDRIVLRRKRRSDPRFPSSYWKM